jgi:hypothetical protein
MARALRRTLQLKITLRGSKPPIWRRVLVPDNITLGDLHLAIQIAMGWTDAHMHQFIDREGQCYGVSNPDWDFESMHDEDAVLIGKLFKKEKTSLRYEYDFGDGWEHAVTLEKILPFDRTQSLPVCLKAVGACPPEDVGGIYGYYRFLDAYTNPEHPEHEDFREWMGDDFQPGNPDLAEINEDLAGLVR